jgi:hypothetical protein
METLEVRKNQRMAGKLCTTAAPTFSGLNLLKVMERTPQILLGKGRDISISIRAAGVTLSFNFSIIMMN